MAEKKRNRTGVTPTIESKYSKKYLPETSSKTSKSSIKLPNSVGKTKERTKILPGNSLEEDIGVRKNQRNKVDLKNAVAKKSTKIKESKPQISVKQKSVVKIDSLSEKKKTVGKIEVVKAQVKNGIISSPSGKDSVKVSGAIKNKGKSATFIKEDETNKVHTDSTQEDYDYEDYDYEDDFEEYESDFEECTDEEDDVGSTHSDSNTSNELNEKDEENTTIEVSEKDFIGETDNIEDSLKVEEIASCDRDGKAFDESILPDIRAVEAIKEISLSEKETVQLNESLNLASLSSQKEHGRHAVYGCKREKLDEKEAKRVAKRGKRLLKMIALDEISFMLFELPPVPYEVLMRIRNHGNMKQVSVQTNEDALTEATQTDVVMKCDVWTQKPPIFGSSGRDMEEDMIAKLGNISWSSLEKFIASAGEMIIVMLEEQMSEFLPRKQGGESNTFVSDFSVLLGQEDSFAEFWKELCSSRPIYCAYFCKTLTNLLICSHGIDPNNVESFKSTISKDHNEDSNQFLESSILSIWNINEPSRPKCLLCCQGNVSKVCLGEYYSKHQQLAFAGTDEGTIYLWDFYDKGPNLRKKVFKARSHEEALICPSFYTTGKQHQGRIVGLEIALHSVFEGEEFGVNNKITSPQLCSLDEWGMIIVWSVIKKGKNQYETYELIPSLHLSLEETCSEWKKSVHSSSSERQRKRSSSESEEGNGIWKSLAVGCNCMIAGSQSGSIVYIPLDCDVNSVQVYSSPNDSFASAECIAMNPHGLPFFMVGNSFGKVELYDCISAQCLTSWDTGLESSQSSITNIAWSPQRPLVFFVVEDYLRLSVWDLALSDIYPIGTIPTSKNESKAFTVSYASGSCPVYVVFGSESGQVILYQLREELWHIDDNVRKKEISKFRKYMNHL